MVFDSGKYYDVGNWTWSLKFAWLPARMDSGELVWWKEYYHGVRMVSGPGTPVYLFQYMTTEEFTWSALQES
jgi:hypothetical protein